MKEAGGLASDPHRRAIAKRLRLMREILGLKQIQVIRATRIPQASWNAYELGRQLISYPNLYKLKRTYGVTADWILYGDPRGMPDVFVRFLMSVD